MKSSGAAVVVLVTQSNLICLAACVPILLKKKNGQRLKKKKLFANLLKMPSWHQLLSVAARLERNNNNSSKRPNTEAHSGYRTLNRARIQRSDHPGAKAPSNSSAGWRSSPPQNALADRDAASCVKALPRGKGELTPWQDAACL